MHTWINKDNFRVSSLLAVISLKQSELSGSLHDYPFKQYLLRRFHSFQMNALNIKPSDIFVITCFVDISTVQGLSSPFRNFPYGMETQYDIWVCGIMLVEIFNLNQLVSQVDLLPAAAKLIFLSAKPSDVPDYSA